jgi:outer membrane lipoprotein-sorting protein
MKVFKITVATLSILSLVGQAQAQTADEIIAKHIEAMGSMEKWKAVERIELNQKTSAQGFEVGIKQTIVKDMAFRQEVSVMGQEMILAFDGTTTWRNAPAMMGGTGEPEAIESTEDNKSRTQPAGFAGTILSLKEKNAKFELAGEEKVNGADAFKIKMTTEKGKEVVALISKTNYYLLKLVMDNDGTSMEITFADYKVIEGLAFPFSIELPNPQMGGMMTLETESVKINPTVDMSIFKMPAK